MKTTVKHLSDTRVLLTVTAGAEELAAAELVALKKLAKDVKVNGFRKGHVPIEVVKKNIDPNTLAQETLENALSKGVADAFMGEDIRVLERPEVDVKKFVPGESLEFTAEADVLPNITLGDYKKLQVETKPVKVGKKDIDEVLDRMRSNSSEKKESKKAAKLGDEVVIDFVGKMDGEAFEGGTGNDYPLTLGSGSFIPGFEEALVGAKAGDKRDVPLTFPADYHAKQLAGKEVVFETTVKKVHEIILPELTDEFAAKMGPFTSVDELTNDIERELTARAEQTAADEQKDELVKQLVAKSKVSVPAVLREDQIKSIEQDLMQNLMYRGQSIDDYFAAQGFKDRDEWVEKEANDAADNRIKAGLVLAELSKVLKIEATADELAAHINQYKEQYKNDADTAKRFDEPDVQREVANRLITEKTVDELLKLATSKKK